MFPRQEDPDADNDAHEKADDEAESGCVTHRAFGQVKNSWRLVFVHRGILDGCAGLRQVRAL